MSPLEQLQSFIFGRLRSYRSPLTRARYFDDVAGFLLRPRMKRVSGVDVLETVPEITTQIQMALTGLTKFKGGVEDKEAGKAGVAFTVLMPFAGVESPDVPGPEFHVRTIVRVQENSVLNMGVSGTHKSAEEIALEVCRALHQWCPNGVCSQLVCTRDAVKWNERYVDQGLWTYDVEVEATFSIEPPRQVTPPLIAIDGEWPQATATITCATDGATILYTLDGSLPYELNPHAVTYAGPFTVAEPCTIYAVAVREDLAPSNPQWEEIEGSELLTDAGAPLTDDQNNPLHAS